VARAFDFANDAFGRVTQTTFPSNLFETYACDAFNRLAGSAKNSSLVAYSYGYDRSGNRWPQTKMLTDARKKEGQEREQRGEQEQQNCAMGLAPC
jgi:YD repeat-containing protein